MSVKDHNGIEFSSEMEMCISHGVSMSHYRESLAAGRSLESALTPPRIITRNGRSMLNPFYRDEAKAQEDADKLARARKRQQKARKLAKDSTPIAGPLIIKAYGHTYLSLKEACEDLDLPYQVMNRLMLEGLTFKQAHERTKSTYRNNEHVDHKGKEHGTLENMCNRWGITVRAFRYRRNTCGACLQEALETPSYKHTGARYQGQKYKSYTELCRTFNKKYSDMVKALRSEGLSIHEFLTNTRIREKNFQYQADCVATEFNSGNPSVEAIAWRKEFDRLNREGNLPPYCGPILRGLDKTTKSIKDIEQEAAKRKDELDKQSLWGQQFESNVKACRAHYLRYLTRPRGGELATTEQRRLSEWCGELRKRLERGDITKQERATLRVYLPWLLEDASQPAFAYYMHKTSRLDKAGDYDLGGLGLRGSVILRLAEQGIHTRQEIYARLDDAYQMAKTCSVYEMNQKLKSHLMRAGLTTIKDWRVFKSNELSEFLLKKADPSYHEYTLKLLAYSRLIKYGISEFVSNPNIETKDMNFRVAKTILQLPEEDAIVLIRLAFGETKLEEVGKNRVKFIRACWLTTPNKGYILNDTNGATKDHAEPTYQQVEVKRPIRDLHTRIQRDNSNLSDEELEELRASDDSVHRIMRQSHALALNRLGVHLQDELRALYSSCSTPDELYSWLTEQPGIGRNKATGILNSYLANDKENSVETSLVDGENESSNVVMKAFKTLVAKSINTQV